ncbi:PepSY domain-containing protein [Alteromonas sp. 5E99-2]|uniref:PepSY-associated TM helix domain-containing protein n=1 Tax=Alteromonas sp. 5E99-2 TaxID=2817683 RepID=UPI001A99FF9D|nr:PepSY domain-containing protein [Alteromonas sp. 5E99-2]MBO1254391.1 PepSY domain-containing protein [Alteromonas sp. 5E99-2]
MLQKNNLLNIWLWKWHVIAGLITLPFVALLAITGTIYLFKDNVNHQVYAAQYFVPEGNIGQPKLSLSEQFALAKASTDKTITGVTLAEDEKYNTAFKLKGKSRAGNELFVDPHTGAVKGAVNQQETFMYDVRKLHGELLLAKPGTLVVELVASWFIVLILTGVYVWFPHKGAGNGGVFSIRFDQGKQKLFRDLHAVLGFWCSLVLLMFLAGGMPWTDMFGSQLKWVQKQTNTGYPMLWQSGKGLESTNPNNVEPLNLDAIAKIAIQDYQLSGDISITLPKGTEGTYKITNHAFYTEDQSVLYVNQYTGETIKHLTWDQVGILMDARQLFMRLHQGEYGLLNWIAVLTVAVLLFISATGACLSYLKRKPQGSWGIPRVPQRFNADKTLVGIIVLLGVVFPMFGISLVVITVFSILKSTFRKTKEVA